MALSISFSLSSRVALRSTVSMPDLIASRAPAPLPSRGDLCRCAFRGLSVDRRAMPSFAELGAPEPLATALAARGYETPTPVQAVVLEADAQGRDLLVSARTGSGKTVAFGLAVGAEPPPLAKPGKPLCLVVAPTRELAHQVARELSWLLAGGRGAGGGGGGGAGGGVRRRGGRGGRAARAEERRPRRGRDAGPALRSPRAPLAAARRLE